MNRRSAGNYAFWAHYLLPALAVAVAGCSRKPANANWLRYGLTQDDHRFSTLTDISETSVSRLGLVWSRELNTMRGLEATPLVKDGVIYVTGSWSIVYAIDARTGAVRWNFDPKVARSRAFFMCCDATNRGVALYDGKVYVGTLDGHLIALDERTGSPVWDVSTVDGNWPYTITSAPRVAKDLIVIGNTGGEYGVRGYVSAYDAKTGKLAWRFYTVPGDPAKGFESPAMEKAAKTWSGKWWTTGGGGAAWEGAAYDPDLDLIYFGTGNPAAWYRGLRGDGKGDDLYTSSIVALHASTGELAWYFQTVPGDNWDYDATQPLVQADLSIAGHRRRVLLQANKNGYFYVLDRATGEFLSGTAFVPGITWATGLDPKSGRPMIAQDAYNGFKPVMVSPYASGAHTWDPMAFSPVTNLIYLSARSGTQAVHAPDPKWKYNPDGYNVGEDAQYEGPLYQKVAAMPEPVGELIAWDPVAQRAAWRTGYPVVQGGGVLATAGNLVFQGRADGILAAYRATDGKVLWQFDGATGIMAPPVTWSLDGVQYISVLAGWGGADGLVNDPSKGVKPGYGRLLTFALDGKAPKPAPLGPTGPPPSPDFKMASTSAMVHEGKLLFNDTCAYCHGMNAVAGPLPDLRYLPKAMHEQFENIVLGGAFASAGMPSFSKLYTPDQVRAIHAYLLARAAGQEK
jgi:PQQ-dependent dehydrogenase (methanol/ethanol family)